MVKTVRHFGKCEKSCLILFHFINSPWSLLNGYVHTNIMCDYGLLNIFLFVAVMCRKKIGIERETHGGEIMRIATHLACKSSKQASLVSVIEMENFFMLCTNLRSACAKKWKLNQFQNEWKISEKSYKMKSRILNLSTLSSCI